MVLEWARDARGYRLVEAIPAALLPENPLMPEGWRFRHPIVPERPQRIVRHGGTLIPYQPTATLDLIFREFINTDPTPEGILGFVNRFGPLTRSGNQYVEGEGEKMIGDPVEWVIDSLNFMIETLATDARDKEAHRFLGRALGADGIRLNGIEVRLVFDERTQSPRILQVPGDLWTALYLRLFEVQLSDIALRRCGHCNALFTAGLGTGRHLNAKFCSDEHRIQFNSLKRTPRAA
jgi:hypothetical protein